MPDLSQQILRTDASGMPLEWIDYRHAVKLHFLDMIAYTLGSPIMTIQGGVNARNRQRSRLALHSIIATHGNQADACATRLIHLKDGAVREDRDLI